MIRWPNRRFWQKLGFEVSGHDDEFEVVMPGWAFGIVVAIVVLTIRAIFNVIFG